MSQGGNPQGLARAERKLGLESVCATHRVEYFRYPADQVLLKEGEHPLRGELRRGCLFLEAIRRFDIIHYNAGQTLFFANPGLAGSGSSVGASLRRMCKRPFHMVDLAVLRELGKGIVVTYQGDDARQGDYSRKHFEISIAGRVGDEYYNAKSDGAKRQCIAEFGRRAHRIFALNPDLLHVLPGRTRFLPYASVDLSEWFPAPRREAIGPPVVLHAPSHRRAKGTDLIQQAVDRLRREEGIQLEFLLVENMSRDEARALYARADILVDQLFAGWYGGLAVELMALGKPVISYIREGDLRFIPPAMATELPIIRATPDAITEVLRIWITERRGELKDLGAKCRAFVERWHDPMIIAASLKEEYQRILDEQRSS
jgi:hypothetical protein